jgi:hypothetical protein
VGTTGSLAVSTALGGCRFRGSACDYLDVADSKGPHRGLDLRCIADQDRDQAVLGEIM